MGLRNLPTIQGDEETLSEIGDFLAGASRRRNCHCDISDSNSIKQQVFSLLDKNPLLTPKPLCKLLGLSYRKYEHYLRNLRTEWKCHYRNERGSKCSIHGWRGWCYLPNSAVAGIRSHAVEVGWVETRARNRWLLWKDRLGRLQWFETGRVNLYVRKPANLGKAYQLVCNGFSFTGLVTDIKVLEQVLSTLRFKGAHYVFPTEQRLPRLTIDLFAKSNGVIIKVGDRSHPHAVEVVACYPDWGERCEATVQRFIQVLENLLNGPSINQKKKVDYVS